MDICTWFNEAGLTSTYVINNSEIARKWLKLKSELSNTIPIVKWNHHRCTIEDYAKQLDTWQHLKALALSLGITVTAEPDQTSINLVHRYFVDAIRVDRARARLWVELNTLLHYHEYLLQKRGASTSIDYTQTPMRPRFLVAEDGLPEPIQAGGLYLMYSQLGRNWEEIWRAGHFKQARKLQLIYDNAKVSKPKISNIEAELDSRFVELNLDNETIFDGWLTLTSLGNKVKLEIPFKRTKHFNNLFAKGELLKGIRLSRDTVTFMFEMPEKEFVKGNIVLGIDIGQTDLYALSTGVLSPTNKHGYNLSNITDKICTFKKGTKGFANACKLRSNYINWAINKIDLSGVGCIKFEDISNLRKGVTSSKKLSRWVYAEVGNKIANYCTDNNVYYEKVSPAYTSQRCSVCGWVRKANRKGKLFVCTSCGFEHDADINAAVNISLPLLGISKKQRLLRLNIKGFYWNAMSSANIVPGTKETECNALHYFK